MEIKGLEFANVIKLKADVFNCLISLQSEISALNSHLTTEINAKSYRKALSSIEEYGVDGCNVIIQGTMKQYGVVDDTGLVVQPKKTTSSE